MTLDVIIVIVAILGFMTGYKRGIINTVFDTFSIIIAIVATMKLWSLTVALIDSLFKLSSGVSILVGIVLTFFIVMFLVRFIGKNLEKILKTVHLNFVNKFAGGALMAGVFTLVLSGILLLSNELKIIPESTRQESMTYPLVSALPNQAKGVFNVVRPMFEDFWTATMNAVDDIKDKGDEVLETREG